MTPKELADEESEIKFEDDKVLFIKVKGYDAMDYYASEKLKREYNKFNRYGDVYLIVDKDGENSYVLNQVRNGYTDVLDFDGMVNNFMDVIEDYPQLESKLVEFIKPENPYEMLLLIKAGKKYDKWDMRSIDESLNGMTLNEKNPGKSMIQLMFDADEYISFFDYKEGEWDARILGSIFGNSYYGSSFDLIPSDMTWDDWKEGYMFGSFDDKNKKKLDDIVSFLIPGVKDLKDKDEDKYNKSVVQFLDTNFPVVGERIADEYNSLRNESAVEKIKEIGIKDIADVFQQYGVFRKSGVFTNYVTTVNILLSLYKKTQSKQATIVELFKELGEEMDLDIGYYNEVAMDSWDFDFEQFNDVVGDQLDTILEEIEDEPEKFEAFKNYADVLKKLNNMGYEIGGQYKVPNTDNSFRVEEIRKDDSKIVIVHWNKSSGRGERRSYTIEEFANYLHSPELFESLVKRLKRIV
jgi:hypothetical protein